MPKAKKDPGSESKSLLLDYQLCFALYSTSLAVTKLYRPLLATLGVTYPQYLVLLVLWETDGLGVGELGERLHLDSGTLTPLLKRMEQSQWVLRTRSAQDERRVEVSLTRAGKQLKERATGIPACLLQKSGCSANALLALTRQLQELRSRMAGTP